NLLEIAERLDQLGLVLARDDEQRQILPPSRDQLARMPRRRLLEELAVDDRDRARLGVIGERGGERGLARLLVHLDLEAAHRRRADDAAAGPLRGASRARAGP